MMTRPDSIIGMTSTLLQHLDATLNNICYKEEAIEAMITTIMELKEGWCRSRYTDKPSIYLKDNRQTAEIMGDILASWLGK